MIELILLYSILCWHGMWWVLWYVTLPLYVLQLLINKRRSGRWTGAIWRA